jgi:hypothetical protein
MRIIRKWNLNETEGRYARTGIKELVVDLDLGLKRAEPANGAFFDQFHFQILRLQQTELIARLV